MEDGFRGRGRPDGAGLMGIETMMGQSVADKAEIKRQFLDTQNISAVGTTSALPIFKIMDRDELQVEDRALIAKSRLVHSGTNSCFVLGHPRLGLLGATGGTQSVLGTANMGAYGTVRIIQPNNVYKEWFYDNTFYGSITGTGTWDTTNHMATLNTSSTVTSARAYMNNSTVKTALLTSSYTGTSLTFYVCSTTSSYEEVSPGTWHTLATAGTDLRWRAKTGASPATITTVNVEFTTI